MVVLVTYDLNKPSQDYPGLYEAIKELGIWWHHLDSTWLVETGLTTQQVSDRIKLKVDESDHFLVIRVTEDYKGWLPRKAWDWLHRRNFGVV